MKFVCNVYTLVIVLTKIIWLIVSEGIFNDMELSYISRNLNTIECSRLLEAMYVERPMTEDEFTQSATKISLGDQSIFRRQLETGFFNRDDCRIKLEEWSRNLPQRNNVWARVTMETVLRKLGRPDLAKYLGRNGRAVRYRENNEIPAKSLIKLGKRMAPSGSVVSGSNQVTSSNEIFTGPPREAVIQYYDRDEEPEVPRERIKTASGKVMRTRGSGEPNKDDLTTRWIAFSVLLGLVALIILSTVFCALYKRKRAHILPTGESNKCWRNNCPAVDRFPRNHSNSDVERGDRETMEESSPCTKRIKHRASIRQPSLSPSSICVREETVQQCRRFNRGKCLEVEEAAVKRRPSRGPKRPNRRCDKNCTGLDEKVTKVDESTLTSERRFEAPSKSRLELKKFHERIASILRKDDTTCACCKCSVVSGDGKNFDSKCLRTKKNICEDDKCPKRRLKTIAEMCLSSDEMSSEDECDDLESKTKAKWTKVFEKQSKQKKKKKKKKKKKTEEEKDKTKKRKKKKTKEESEKSSPENSARSKDKKESRESKMKKPEKAKKDMYNIEEACTRKTCDFRRSIGIDDLSNGNENF